MTKIFVTLTLAAVLCTSFPNVRANSFTDDDLINFALNLECLEAEFYSWAAFGKGLTYKQRGGGPASIGGMKAELGDYAGIAEEIAMEEIRHVELLRGALGAEAVRCPKIDVGPAFAAAANAALGTTLKPPFSPYPDFLKFLIGGLLFEDVGVMAYNGAIGLIKSPEYLTVARGIMAVEAYHAGVIRTLLSKEFTTIVSPYNVPVSTITTAVAAAVDGLLGLARKQPIGSPSGKPNLTPTDGNALVFAVNPDAVLNVVYLSKTAKKGGFFPHGINGFFMKTRGLFEMPCMGKKVARYAQCGGATYTGPTCCEGYSTCVKVNRFYSQCMPK